MMTATASAIAPKPNTSAGGRLVALDGRPLPLLGTRLTAIASGGLCRVLLEQRFKNSHAEPLHVSYLFPLPHDGAVSSFAFLLGERRIVGEVDKLASARERFEEALVEGKTAALLEQVRGSVFSQELGNVPPGAEVVAELTIDQKLAWLPEGAWEWRFPTALAPRYQGADGRVPDAGRIEVPIADGEVTARLSLSLRVGDRLATGGGLTSPTHALQLRSEGGTASAGLQAEGGAPLDRDVAIRWPVATAEVGVTLDVTRPVAPSRVAGRAFGLLSIVPPTPEALKALPRDLMVLLDTSGSMGGLPLQQAKQVVGALVGSLTDAGTLELIEFSNAPRRWKSKPVEASAKAQKEALTWLAGLGAGGSTEMTDALYEALKGIRAEAQRQVVLVTDGEIGFEAEIVKAILKNLPAGSLLHTVGVGSSVNRSLTGPAARAGRGVEVVLDLDEPADAAAARLLARTVAPVVTELKVTGSALVKCAPGRLPDLFGGAAALVTLELAPAGGTLIVTGVAASGRFERTLTVAANEPVAGHAAIPALFAREAVEDLELLVTTSSAPARLDRAIEALGLTFQISTRLTSWVAVSEEATVDPRQPTRREVMPQQLPYGMSVEGLGLRNSAGAFGVQMAMAPEFGSFETADYSPASIRDTRASFAPPPPRSPAPAFAQGTEVKKERSASKGKAGFARSLPARLVLRTSDRLVVEFEVTEDEFDWTPGTIAQVRLADGRTVEVEVDVKTTTAAGELASGTTVRLVVRLEQAIPTHRELVCIELADASLELLLQPSGP